MPQILDSLPVEQNDRITCCYTNRSAQMQVVRITNVPNWYFERVVFPTQRLLFEAPYVGVLEIHTGMMASAILSDRLPCIELQSEDVPTFPPLFVSDAVPSELITSPIIPNPISQDVLEAA